MRATESDMAQLGARPRRGTCGIARAGVLDQSAALALLTPVERAALGLAALDDPVPPNASSLLAAASGLAKLASAHLGRRMVEDEDAPELTRRDRLALAFAPRLGLDLHQTMTTDEGPATAHDPILALLEGAQDDVPSHLVVSARLDLGSRGTDGADES